jgi:hypothetical protein
MVSACLPLAPGRFALIDTFAREIVARFLGVVRIA